MRVDNLILDRWQKLDASNVPLAVADYAKEDASFVPAKNAATIRNARSIRDIDISSLTVSNVASISMIAAPAPGQLRSFERVH